MFIIILYYYNIEFKHKQLRYKSTIIELYCCWIT